MRRFRVVHDDLGGYAVQFRDFADFHWFWGYMFPSFGNHESFKTLEEAEDDMRKQELAEDRRCAARKLSGKRPRSSATKLEVKK